MAFCSKCGTQLADGAKFCASCGTSVGGTASEPRSAAPNTAEAKEKLKEKLHTANGHAGTGINKLPFKKLAESKIPAGARTKFPLLDKAILFANWIACGLALVLVILIIVAAGEDNSPKGLAKQSYQLLQKADKVGDNYVKAASYANKSLKVAEKVEKLPAAAQEVYMKELARLMGDSSASLSGGSGGGTRYIEVTASKAEQFKYDLTADGNGVVIKGLQTPPDGYSYYNIIIPAIIEGYPVVEVEGSLWGVVTFPDTVTTLGDGYFEYSRRDEKYYGSGLLRSVETVKLPPKLTVIPKYLFLWSEITEITIPNGVTEIREGAFRESGLIKIIIPDGVTKIGDDAFFMCRNLTEVTIPASVTEIGEDAFYGCSNLTTVNLPPSHSIKYKVSSLGTFQYCSKLSLAMRKAITDSGYKGEF